MIFHGKEPEFKHQPKQSARHSKPIQRTKKNKKKKKERKKVAITICSLRTRSHENENQANNNRIIQKRCM